MANPFRRVLCRNSYKETHINRALQCTGGSTYVEIGVRNGMCFRRIKAERKIGIDPSRQGFGEERAGELFFEMTSDAFFEGCADPLFDRDRIDVALVDGLHEFEQSLRDVLHLEVCMASGGVIFIHDCNPRKRRHVEIRDGGIWNGDVWKIACYLRMFRKDLDFLTLDCDFGLGVVTGFKESPDEHRPEPRNIAFCKQLDYSELEKDRTSVLNLKPVGLSRKLFKP